MAATHDVSEAVLAFTEHEHLVLARGIDRIHEAARGVGQLAGPESVLRVRDVLDWFDRDLVPHLGWEETWLYPRIDAVAGTAWATRALRFDHGQLRTVIDGLRADERDAVRDHSRAVDERLRCRLFALEAMVRAHLEREERLLFPLLVQDEPRPRTLA
jgi:iron-sulfur cluster repair protein YtfE (RIC family)